jgi:hypothetical protein
MCKETEKVGRLGSGIKGDVVGSVQTNWSWHFVSDQLESEHLLEVVEAVMTVAVVVVVVPD